MKRQLAGALLMIIAAGCSQPTVATKAEQGISIQGNVKYGTFVQENVAKLAPSTPVSDLYVTGDTVFAYTEDNTVYALSSGLEIRYIEPIVKDEFTLRKPVAYGEETIFPSTVAMFVHDKRGNRVRTLNLPNPLTSDARLDQRGLLLAGTAAPTGGRVSVIDPTLLVRPVVGDTLIGTVFSAPVGYQGIVYAANNKGEVFAIGAGNRNAWPLDDMRFDTDRSVRADLVIDDYGLFVASGDTKLYALDRTTGRIKWRYMSEMPLVDTPLVTTDRVYQVVPGRGAAAIDKLEGKLYREPLWIAPGITQVLKADANYLYAVRDGNTLVALGLNDGKEKFSVSGDFSLFVADETGRIFAANSKGTVSCFVRAPYTGDNVAAK